MLSSIVNHFDDGYRKAAKYLKLVISGGADLSNDLRQASQEILGVPVIDVYGLSEVGGIASECMEQDGLHVYADDIIAEILTDTYRLQPSGHGELVVSSVANAAMPFLRYRTGDIVNLDWEPCKCGRKGPRLRDIKGRLFQNFKLRDGSEISPTVFNRVLFDLFPIREFRLTQTHLDRINVEIEFLPSCRGTTTEQLEQVQKHIERELRFLVKVDVSEAAFSPHDKFQRYRTLLDKEVVES
jgi:phenylacetate-CoA ligase